ncbi:hypothetical protein ABK040_008769 [Willaertia magna]
MKLVILALFAVLLTVSFSLSAAPTEFCDVCKYLVAEAEQEAQQDASQVQQALLGACNQLGDNAFGKICQTLVLVYGKQLLDNILAFETPDRVCSEQLPLCPKNNTQVFEAPKPQVQGSGECTLCTFLVKEVEGLLARQKTEDEIIKELNKVCSKVPSILSKGCLSLVKMVPYIITKLESNMPPEKICQGLHFCDKAMKVVAAPKQNVEVESGLTCTVCMAAIELVEQEVTKKDNQDYVEGKLLKVCSKLPKKWAGSCGSLISQYFPLLVQNILQAASPSAICQLVDACPSGKPVSSVKAHLMKIH